MNFSLKRGQRKKSDILAIILIGAIVIIIVQLFYIQIVRHDYYKQLAYDEQVAKFTLRRSEERSILTARAQFRRLC